MEHESVRLLSEYLRINTTNPPGNEDKAVDFFAGIFYEAGIEYKIYQSPEGRQSIRAILPGSGEKGAVILLNHMDVVPANADEWSFDPFCGEIKDGFIRGRGALDMKGQGIMELVSFLELKREAAKLSRDLIFLAVADEETGGSNGVKFLLDNHFEDFKADVVVNEGGLGIADLSPNHTVMMVSTAEKGVCWLKLTRKGLPGHGSAPHENNALENLMAAVNRLLADKSPITVKPVMAEYFRKLADAWEFLKPYAEDGKDETLIRIVKESGLLAMPQISAMLRNTISLNVMKAGSKTNVIPSLAVADLDARLLPDQEIDDFIGSVRDKLADDEIDIDIIAAAKASESPVDTDDCQRILQVLGDSFPDAIITPWLMIGTSDSRFFREKGIPCYGVCPKFISMDHMKMIHGIDEQISIENMVEGSKVFCEIVRKLCV